MNLLQLLLGLLALGLGCAAAALPDNLELNTTLHQLVKRNPCDGVDGMPILYHEYHEDECPPRWRFDPMRFGWCDGCCEHGSDMDNARRKYFETDKTCMTFCQLREWRSFRPVLS